MRVKKKKKYLLDVGENDARQLSDQVTPPPLCLHLERLGFGVWGLGFGVWGLGNGVWDLGFRVEG